MNQALYAHMNNKRKNKKIKIPEEKKMFIKHFNKFSGVIQIIKLIGYKLIYIIYNFIYF
jgi:hypothetical protein